MAYYHMLFLYDSTSEQTGTLLLYLTVKMAYHIVGGGKVNLIIPWTTCQTAIWETMYLGIARLNDILVLFFA